MPLSPGLKRNFPNHSGHAKTNGELPAHKQQACSSHVEEISHSIDVSCIVCRERSLADDYSLLEADCTVALTSEAYSTKLRDAGEAVLTHNHERGMTALRY